MPKRMSSCLHCCRVFASLAIIRFVDERGQPICPLCGEAAVVGGEMSAHEMNLAHQLLYPTFGVNPPIEWLDDHPQDDQDGS